MKKIKILLFSFMSLLISFNAFAIDFPDFKSGYVCWSGNNPNNVFEGYVSRIAATTLYQGWNGYYIEVTSMDGKVKKSGYVYYRWYGYQQIAHLAYISKIYGYRVKICYDTTYIYSMSLED